MRFSIIYQNDGALRKRILEEWLPQIVVQIDLRAQPFKHPMLPFQTVPVWPSYEELERMPLNMQVEYLEYDGKKFLSIRALCIEIEPRNDCRAVTKYKRRK